ncbi:MAG: hypothetical protein JWO15_3646, partial [Sphingomonadales bacterium]|nr:hypothetical protein [Sphingomonadales bacterium]
MATRMQQRRGTAAEWAAANPVLAAGEIGVTSDTKVIKFGDGTTAWADLASAYMRKGGKESVSEGAGQNTAYVSSLNDLLRSGWYNVSGATGAPDATNWWLVMVITHVYNGNYQRQIAYDMTGGTSRVMSRHCTGADPTLPASWQPWVDTNAATNPQIIQNTLVDAQGDLLIGTADNTVGRLPKGTPGQQLTVMPDGTSLQWTTPPSTDLSSRVPLATVQAAGDLIVGTANAAVGRLGMGGAGLVLTVNAAGTGLVWAVPTVSVAKTGDTMSGNLAIAATVPALVLNDLGSSSPNYKKSFIRHANDRLEIMDDSNSVILATIANDGHLNALALYDNG